MTSANLQSDQLSRALSPGQTAVVTGAALGIGRALVCDLAARGLRVVAVDVDATELSRTAEMANGTVLPRQVDVADMAAMTALAEDIGEVAFLVNNAASRAGQGFDAPLADWHRALDVNLWGVVHGVRAFLPRMRHGIIVNVGSKQGITNPPGHPVYNLSKAAVKSYTEQLAHDLHRRRAQITAHLLVPGWTTTGHAEHRPGAWRPEQVVARLIEGLDRGSFYILCPDDEVTEDMDRARIRWAADDICQDRPALSRWHADWAARARVEMGET